MKPHDKIYSPIWECAGSDDLRPDLKLIHFQNNFVYCTDANIAIRQSLDLWQIDETERENMNGKSISANDLKKLCKDQRFFEFRPDYYGTNEIRLQYVKPDSEIKNILDTIDQLFTIDPDRIQTVPIFGFNPELTTRLHKAMFRDIKAFNSFICLARGKNKPFVCLDNYEQNIYLNAGLFMPVYFEDRFDDVRAWAVLPEDKHELERVEP